MSQPTVTRIIARRLADVLQYFPRTRCLWPSPSNELIVTSQSHRPQSLGLRVFLGELLGPSGSVLTRRSLGRLAGIRESGFHDFPAGSSLGVADALAAPCPK